MELGQKLEQRAEQGKWKAIQKILRGYSLRNNIQHMIKQQEQFLQLPDEIPYRKITNFNIIQVTYKSDSFEVKLNTKYQNLPADKDYTIIRKLNDFKWLLEKLEKQNPDVVVLPSIINMTSWSLIQSITAKLSNQSKKQERRRSNQYFMCRGIERFLSMLSLVALPYIYRVPGFTQSSLFAFLDPSYELYKLQTYQKQTTSKQVINQAPTSSLTTIAQTIGKGSMKLLSMLNVGKTEQKKYLQSEKNKYLQIQMNIKQVNDEIQNVEKCLQSLTQNFLNEQVFLKQKQLEVYKIYLRSVGIMRTVTQIINEINQVVRKTETAETKSDQKQLFRAQVEIYGKFVIKQAEKISKQFQGLINQFYKKFFQNKVEIKLANIYPSKL